MTSPERNEASLSSRRVTRRSFFESVSGGIYGAALASLLKSDLAAVESTVAQPESLTAPRRIHDMRPRPPHFEPAAKSVIQLFMNGGPSQMDLFDPKIELEKNHGKAHFEKIASELESPTQAGTIMKSHFKFARHGECGADVSELMPHFAKVVDDVAFIRSMYTTNLTHEPALFKIHTGQMISGLPVMGSWITYGLGSVNQNLPGYVVLEDPLGLPVNHEMAWKSGYLPPVYQGTRFRSTGSPVLNLAPEFEEPEEVTKLERQLIGALDRRHRAQRFGQPQLAARIASYELAARMQMAASDALDVSQETEQTRELYGVGKKPTDSYGRRCLIARRLVERGVRFVQLFIDFQIWDHHSNIENGLRSACARTDQPIAALITDLKRRGLLDETLIVWGGEFGRLPIAQVGGGTRTVGRDHNKNAMATWMAGGGVKGGITYGATDELGFAAVENKVAVQDWHATILHQIGLDHHDLYYERNGLKDRLTGTFEARVVKEILV